MLSKMQYWDIFFVDKMKQYLEQLRKECSDRMVNIVMDSETDKPSKVRKKNFSFERKNIYLKYLVVALFRSSSFYG